MHNYITIFFTIFALTSAGDVLQGPSVRNIILGPDGSIVDSTSVGGSVIGGLSSIEANLHDPVLRTFNVNPTGIVNSNSVPGVIYTDLPLTTGIQGSSTRNFNAGPDESFIHSATAEGGVSDDLSILLPPSLHIPNGYGVKQVLVPNTLINVFPGTKSFYAPGFYSNYLPIPYRHVIAGPSGTILAN